MSTAEKLVGDIKTLSLVLDRDEISESLSDASMARKALLFAIQAYDMAENLTQKLEVQSAEIVALKAELDALKKSQNKLEKTAVATEKLVQHRRAHQVKWYPEDAAYGDLRYAWDKTECARFIFGSGRATPNVMDNLMKKWPKHLAGKDIDPATITSSDKKKYCFFKYEKPSGHTRMTLRERILEELTECYRNKGLLD
jgi:hypothetical protein